jgi:hypothetical protein
MYRSLFPVGNWILVIHYWIFINVSREAHKGLDTRLKDTRRKTKLRTPNVKLRTPNVKLRTPNVKPRLRLGTRAAPNVKLRTPNVEPRQQTTSFRKPLTFILLPFAFCLFRYMAMGGGLPRIPLISGAPRTRVWYNIFHIHLIHDE